MQDRMQIRGCSYIIDRDIEEVYDRFCDIGYIQPHDATELKKTYQSEHGIVSINLTKGANIGFIDQTEQSPEGWPENNTCHCALFFNERDETFYRIYSTRLDVLPIAFIYFCFLGKTDRFLNEFYNEFLA